MRQLFLFVALLSMVFSAVAAEVDVMLKDGKRVSGAVLVDDSEKLVILVTASNGVYRQTIAKSDVVEMKEHASVPQGPVGAKDLESLQRKTRAAEEELRHREKLAAKAQDSLDEFLRTRQRSAESALQRVSLDKREAELKARLFSARTRVEMARSNFKTLLSDLDATRQKLVEQEKTAK